MPTQCTQMDRKETWKVFHIMRVPYLNLKIHSYVKLFNEFLKNVANFK